MSDAISDAINEARLEEEFRNFLKAVVNFLETQSDNNREKAIELAYCRRKYCDDPESFLDKLLDGHNQAWANLMREIRDECIYEFYQQAKALSPFAEMTLVFYDRHGSLLIPNAFENNSRGDQHIIAGMAYNKYPGRKDWKMALVVAEMFRDKWIINQVIPSE